jgi:TrmH family RNA methyltransferase
MEWSEVTDIITSRTNSKVKAWRSIADQSRLMQRAGQLWVEGDHLLSEAILAGWSVQTLIVCENAPIEHPSDQVYRVSAAVLSSLSQLDSAPKVVAILSPPEPPKLQPITSDALVLDGVQDPGNLGTMLRTARAFGVADVLLTPGSASAWSMKALRAGQGAQFGLNIREGIAPAELPGLLRVPLVATLLEAPRAVQEVDLRAPIAWVFGNEGQGVCTDLHAIAAIQLRIPMSGAIESLNVAAACAICLYETQRQRNPASIRKEMP